MGYDYTRMAFEQVIRVDAIITLFYMELSKSFCYGGERHDFWEMVYIDRGECYVIADGERFLLSQGEMYFHKPYERHLLEMKKGEHPNVLIITFNTVSRAMSYFEGCKVKATREIKEQLATILHEAMHTYVPPFLKTQPLERNDNGLWGSEQSILLRLELLLIELVRRNRYYMDSPQMFHAKEIVTDAFCLSVIGYMESHIYEKITLDALAQHLSFSKSYISRRFLSVCGHSVMEYFSRMKIQEGKRLIRETDLNFQEISERLMLANPHYFSTLFKKYVGMTPTQYKKSCRRD
jgi:AraC-like DNA-binding protein